MAGWMLDMRSTTRLLARRRGYTLVVVATLGAAVCANVLVLEVLSSTLWRALPFQTPDSLIRLSEVDRDCQTLAGTASPWAVAFWTARAKMAGPIAAMDRIRWALGGTDWQVAQLSSAARLLWPGVDPIGRRLRSSARTGRDEVVAAFVLVPALAGGFGAVAQAAAARNRDLAIRSALGASPTRIVAHLVAWHLTLAVVGIAAGMGLGVGIAATARASILPGLVIDPAAVCLSLLVPLLVVAVSGGLPALRAAKLDVADRLRVE